MNGDSFVQGAMTKYWTFARGGAWRNPKPTGGLYVCEQCGLDARSGNDSTLTLQVVTAIELTPTDVCADSAACNRSSTCRLQPLTRLSALLASTVTTPA